jgi:hypothetical protein
LDELSFETSFGNAGSDRPSQGKTENLATSQVYSKNSGPRGLPGKQVSYSQRKVIQNLKKKKKKQGTK